MRCCAIKYIFASRSRHFYLVINVLFCFAKKERTKGDPKTMTARFRGSSLILLQYYCSELHSFPGQRLYSKNDNVHHPISIQLSALLSLFFFATVVNYIRSLVSACSGRLDSIYQTIISHHQYPKNLCSNLKKNERLRLFQQPTG